MKMILNIDKETPGNEHLETEYCCNRMKKAFDTNKYGLHFDKRFCETFCDRRDLKGCYWHWDYCPFCGKCIKDKGDLYRKILRTELNISDMYEDGVEEKLPEEFKTDEWWKKRGL